MTLARLIAVALATLAAACASAASADAAGCASTGYRYAGIRAAAPVRGLAATLSAADGPRVTSGHVAGWVGVSGDAGWLQIGISSLPGGRTELYVESRVADAEPVYQPLRRVGVGSAHRVAVLEGATDVWTAWLDGRAVSPPLDLAGSHASWVPLATTETFDGGRTRCNSFAFQFERLQTAAPNGAWQPLARVGRFADRGFQFWTPSVGAFLVARP
jgi:hypothetical protein